MGEQNRHRHQFRGLVAGIAEHDPLIAGPLVLEHPFTFGNPHGNIRRLLVDRGKYSAGFPVKPHGRVIIADLPDGLTNNGGHVCIGCGGYLAGNNRHTGCYHGFTGNPVLLDPGQ